VSRILLGQLAVQVLVAIPLGCVFGYALAWLIVLLIQSEDLRIPLVIEPATYAYAALVMVLAGIASAMAVRRRVDRLDLVGVLKTRE
jgi:putative ABC transport system permease protein